ncbi:ribbon-helix-helix domain-containing protein [Cetobacterium sp. 2A]|uniref:ribbon-helix-helix domain-containing protein n=1 Tax=Cetobacterium sp. 2A TaxID=2754723 RepID=UPI00163C0ADE|nr:ribbon-helix-helix domain-containing protein [Cetobacterium sp. 2A]MBC2856963.1 ribbon-helix-helix domain-containing protein [Cetobacterium sp. 2A]
MKSINIRLDDKIIEELKHLSKIFGSNVSELIREGVNKILEEKKADPYYRLTNFSEASSDETNDIVKELSKLSDDDLKIVKRKRIKI